MDLTSVFKGRSFNNEIKKGGSNSPPSICATPLKILKKEENSSLFNHYEEILNEGKKDYNVAPFKLGKFHFDQPEEDDDNDMTYGYSESFSPHDDDPRTISSHELVKVLNSSDSTVITYDEEIRLYNGYIVGEKYKDKNDNIVKIVEKNNKEIWIIRNPYLNKLKHNKIRQSRVDFLASMDFEPSFVNMYV